MTKLAPEWVRTSDPVIRSPARYRWTTAPAKIFSKASSFITRLLGRPQPQMYPPVALNQYTLVNRTHKYFIYSVTPLIFASHYFREFRECAKFAKLNVREYVFKKKVFVFLFFLNKNISF